LDSYKSVTTKSMADTFGIGTEFLDKEVSDFIVADRLHSKVDKVTGIIETTRCSPPLREKPYSLPSRPDARNALYQQTVK